MYDRWGIVFCLEDADTIGLSILFCLQQKKYIKKQKKKQKLNWNTDAWNRTLFVRVRVRYRSPYTIAEILKYSLIIISNHMAYNHELFVHVLFVF